jgi:hypothetical protein
MKLASRILLFFVLPFIAVLSIPPDQMGLLIGLAPFAAILFGIMGWLLLRGQSLALTLMIFLQGLNVIVRLLMLFPHAIDVTNGMINFSYLIFNLLGMGLSLWLLLRLDQPDVRVTMVT